MSEKKFCVRYLDASARDLDRIAVGKPDKSMSAALAQIHGILESQANIVGWPITNALERVVCVYPLLCYFVINDDETQVVVKGFARIRIAVD